MSRCMLVEGPGCVCDGGPVNLLSLQWLFQRPSVLLWADEILVSIVDYDNARSYTNEHNGLYGEGIALLLDALREEGIVRIITPEDYLPSLSRESILEQVCFDLSVFGSKAGEPDINGKVEPEMIHTEYGAYCGLMLESMYTNLLMANLMHCSCLVDDNKARYLMHRFDQSKERGLAHGSTFDELYSIAVPELHPHRDFGLFCPNDIAKRCVNAERCLSNVKVNVKKYVDTILVYRENKEIRGLSELVEKYENEYGLSGEEVDKAVKRNILKAQKQLKRSLPQVKRWCSIVTGFTSAVSISSRIANDDVASNLAAAIAGISYVGSKLVNWAIERDDWKITFAEKYANILKCDSPCISSS